MQRKTHRKTELRPRAQIKAHRRAARIITMFVSKVDIFLSSLLEPPKVLGFASVADIVELACVSSKNLPIFLVFLGTRVASLSLLSFFFYSSGLTFDSYLKLKDQ